MSTRLPAPGFEAKITDMEHLAERASKLPHPVVMTNGVFDILHRGHVTYLAQARALGQAWLLRLIPTLLSKCLARVKSAPLMLRLTELPCSRRLKAWIWWLFLKKKSRLKLSKTRTRIFTSKGVTTESRTYLKQSS